MVGVEVTTITTPPTGSGDSSAAFFVSGLTERGDTTGVVTLNSMADYVSLLGGRVSYGALYDALQTFFAEGGGRAYVARKVGASATKGHLQLVDRAGSPVPTVDIVAKDEGAWSTDATVEVQDGLVTNTVTIIVRYKGEQVESFPNLASPAAIVTALATSGYFRATNLASATAAPANNPAVLGATPLSAGTDDRASVNAAALVTALDRFLPELGSGVVAIPGQAYSTVATGIATHCKATNRIGLTAAALGTASTAAASAARTLRTISGAEYLGFIFPWVQIPDGAGGLRTISSEGFVAGVRARAIQQKGIGVAPAGAIAEAQFVSGIETPVSDAQIDSLAADAVSAIRQVGGSVRGYGWRSLSADELNYRWLNARDVMNYVSVKAKTELQRFPFRTIDSRGHLFAEVATALEGILQPLADSEALFGLTDDDGTESDPGYSIQVDSTNNTAVTIARGEVHANVSVRVAPIGDLIKLTITKVALQAQL